MGGRIMRNDAICRIGVFYDGSYFQYAQKYLYHKRDLGWIRFRPLHELLQEYVRSREQTYVTHRVVYAAWFQGLFSSKQGEDHHLRTDRNLHHDLMHAGIQIKYLPMAQNNREKGVDVALAVDALQVGINGQMDVAVLVSGDGDLVPLVGALMQQGVRVVVAYFEYEDEKDKAFANDRLLSCSNYQLNLLQCETDKQLGTLFRAMFFKKTSPM
jgi:uncharacterized LabA/DUF88 family protein